MSIETSKKILKVVGIIGIIFGILTLLGGVFVLLGGGILAGLVSIFGETLGSLAGGIAVIAALSIILSGTITLLEGIFSVNASKDENKIMPAWIFAILGLISAILGVIAAIMGMFSESGAEASSLIGPLLTLLINGSVFMAANTIKKSR